jgi:cell division protein ZapA
MPQISVTINDRVYRMACEDGQEEHLMGLARDVDRRVTSLRGKFGEIGDARLVVMAAITIADELADTGQRIARLEQDIATLLQANDASANRVKDTEAAMAAAISTAADRIEKLTRELNHTIGETVAIG